MLAVSPAPVWRVLHDWQIRAAVEAVEQLTFDGWLSLLGRIEFGGGLDTLDRTIDTLRVFWLD